MRKTSFEKGITGQYNRQNLGALFYPVEGGMSQQFNQIKQWLHELDQIKNKPLEITYNYWDEASHRRMI
ncbi:unnamed protein product [Ilex paraguariensis]|uniref:Uncharacterized protein n=1 Tax=Ilex paraguariensis TaxID=185542 RepID=A0ABC8V3D4_9AQUA